MNAYTYYQRTFPIGEGKTDYEKYLRITELLSLQKPIEQMASPEELLFQVTHQASELWMKLMIHELDRILTFMKNRQLLLAVRSFRHVADIQRVLMAQLDLIATHISVAEYLKIRTALGRGSGMESPGFNWLLEYPDRLWAGYIEVVEGANVSLKEIYMNYERHIELHTLSECMVDFDDLFHKWRTHHFAMVARTIGANSHSLKGLSSQVLQKGAKVRFFPELMAVRDTITNESDLAYGGLPLSDS